jgi:hypothetical protein
MKDGVTQVRSPELGTYCVRVPGRDGRQRPAIANVDFAWTSYPQGNAQVAVHVPASSECGFDSPEFAVITTRIPEQWGASGFPLVVAPADDVAFTVTVV